MTTKTSPQRKAYIESLLLDIIKEFSETPRNLYEIISKEDKVIYLAVMGFDSSIRQTLVKIVSGNEKCGHHYGTFSPRESVWDECNYFFSFKTEEDINICVTDPRTFNMLMNGPEDACRLCKLKIKHESEENWNCPNFLDKNLGEVLENLKQHKDNTYRVLFGKR